MNAELLHSPPSVSIAAEWTQKESFTPGFKHFVRFVKPPIKSRYPDTRWSLFSFEEYRGDRLRS